MTKIELTTFIKAPIERCFDLSRSVDLHKVSMQQSHEEITGGVETGLMKLHDTVTWRATHFGIRFSLQSVITKFSRPFFFTDEMVRGPFKLMTHDHFFYSQESHTTMVDHFYFQAPYGVVGKVIDFVILKRYLTSLLANRNVVIKQYAEANEWQQVLQQEVPSSKL
ncbi:MAG: SRPBCC family protein [Cyclobacteriaceae bacterium]|nr:SRPBCC family protein [Cyclobacteriaceae bacterium]